VKSAPIEAAGFAPGDPLYNLAVAAIVIVAIFLFFLPIFIASKRKVDPLRGVVVVTLLSVFIPPAWLVALVLSFALKKKASPVVSWNAFNPTQPSQNQWSGGMANLFMPASVDPKPLPPVPNADPTNQPQLPLASQMSDQTLSTVWRQLDPRDPRNHEIEREQAYRDQLRRDDARRLDIARSEQLRRDASARQEREERDRRDREDRERGEREEQGRRDREDRERRSW
jgi:hypothetical protein